MAVRRVVTPSGRGVRGYFPSRKMGRMIAWESLLERDAILLLEFSANVVRYQEQPARVYFNQDNEQRLYIPDFEVDLIDERITHIEVKPTSKLVKPEMAIRFAAIKAHYQCGETGFCVLTEKELRKEPKLTNLKLLAYHQPKIDSEADLVGAIQKLALLPAQTIAGATAVLGSSSKVYQLLAANIYACDLNLPITPQTHIYLSNKELRHDPFLF